MNMLLRLFAGLIDGLQFLLFIAFFVLQALTPAGGAGAGAAAGAYLCWNASSGIWEALKAGAACALGGGLAGGALAAVAIPLGMVIDVAISVSLGGALLLFLASRGMFYPQVILPSMLGEMLPVFAFLPFWSYLVHASIKRQKQGAQGGLLSAAVGFAFGSVAREAVVTASTLTQNRYAPKAPQRFSDVRPPQSQDSPEPQPYAKAA